MLNLLAVFVGSTIGTGAARVIIELLFQRRESSKLPFKWTCVEESCTTRFAASHGLVLDRLRDDHMSRHNTTPTSDNN